MTDFTTNIDMNVRMMNEKLRVDRNFDILQRDVLIGGKRTHFYFIDGFVQEETIEKLVQFFYSLKESDIKDIDTFLEVGMPYTEIEKNGHYDEVEKAFLSGQTVMIIDGFDNVYLLTAALIQCVQLQSLTKTRFCVAQETDLLRHLCAMRHF